MPAISWEVTFKCWMEDAQYEHSHSPPTILTGGTRNIIRQYYLVMTYYLFYDLTFFIFFKARKHPDPVSGTIELF